MSGLKTRHVSLMRGENGVLLLDYVLVVFVSNVRPYWRFIMSFMDCLAVSYLCSPERWYLNFHPASFLPHTNSSEDSEQSPPITSSPTHLINSKMPRGGSRRNDHHCPQRGRGNCRWADHPVRYCTTHSEMCPLHDLPHQTYQSCTMCEGERKAAERALRDYQVSSSPPGNGQHKEDRGKKRK